MPSIVFMPPSVVKDDEVEYFYEDYEGDSEDYLPKPRHAMFYVIFAKNCTTFTLGLVGNTLLILMYSRVRTIRTATNTYIFSIAVTDLLLALSCSLLAIINDLFGTWPFSETACKVSQATMEFSNYATVLSLTAVSVERHYAIVYPIKRYVSTTNFSLAVNLLIWVVAMAFTVPKFMYAGVKNYKVNGTQGHKIVQFCLVHQDMTDLARYLSLFDFVVFYTIPLCVVCTLYLNISRHLANSRRPNASLHLTLTDKRKIEQRNKVAKLVLLLSAIFFVGFLPHNLLILRIFILGGTTGYWNSAASYAYCYGCLHFWLNPITLYVYCEPVRKYFNSCLCCCPYFRGDSSTVEESHEPVHLRSLRR